METQIKVSSEKQKPVRKLYGPLYILAAAIIWSFSGVLSKYVGWSAVSIAFMRGVLSAIVIGLITRQWRFSLTPAVLISAFCIFSTSVLFMAANKMTSAANAIVLQYTVPVYILIYSAVFLKTKITKTDIITVFFTLSGILLFLIDHIGHGALVGDLLSLLSGITFAGVFLANRLPKANPQQASFLGCLLHVFLLPFFVTDPAVKKFNRVEWIAVALMGIFLGLAYTAFSRGIRATSALSASLICTVEPILNPVWVFLILGEKPSTLAIIGACIVITTVTYYNVVSVQKKNEEVK